MFKRYAALYDRLYRDKDYASEVSYIASMVSPDALKTILEIGCGTGGHAIELAKRGSQVLGIDQSQQMIDVADSKAARHSLSEAARFIQHDIRSGPTLGRFSAALSLFHVLNYLTRLEDLEAVFGSIRSQLEPGGVFVFDYWHAPCSRADRPEVRVLRKTERDCQLVRISETEIAPIPDIYIVRFQCFFRDDSTHWNEFSEEHPMRAFWPREIESMAQRVGFGQVRHYAWLSNRPPADDDRYVFTVLECPK